MAEQPGVIDFQLFERIKRDDKQAFTLLFHKYYKDLVVFAFSFTKNKQASEEIVQEVFLTIWELRLQLTIQNSLKSYLLKSVQNKCLDWLRHQKIKTGYTQLLLENPDLMDNNTENYLLYSELHEKFLLALNKMPETYAQAYRMNRLEALNYHEIAEKLQISVRTVEVRIGKALLILRNELKDYLWALLILFFQKFF